jgi:Ca2+-binding RTX toxin-like protein
LAPEPVFLQVPAPGEVLAVTVEAGGAYVVDPAAQGLGLEMSWRGDDLVLAFAGAGSIQLQGAAGLTEAAAPPRVVLPDGTELGVDRLYALRDTAAEGTPLETAAGPDAAADGAATDGGFRGYSDYQGAASLAGLAASGTLGEEVLSGPSLFDPLDDRGLDGARTAGEGSGGTGGTEDSDTTDGGATAGVSTTATNGSEASSASTSAAGDGVTDGGSGGSGGTDDGPTDGGTGDGTTAASGSGEGSGGADGDGADGGLVLDGGPGNGNGNAPNPGSGGGNTNGSGPGTGNGGGGGGGNGNGNSQTQFNEGFHGKSGDDEVAGGDGADQLVGGAGDDTLNGGAGDDTLNGGSGDDLLIGGLGDDDLLGGSGADIFLFDFGDGAGQGGFGTDIVRDFDSDAGDVLSFVNVIAIDANSSDAELGDLLSTISGVEDNGRDVTIEFAGGGVVVIEGFGTGAIDSASELLNEIGQASIEVA